MAYYYSDPKRAEEEHALPDVEVFWEPGLGTEENPCEARGWYWWACFPGCLPDGEPNGPFATEAEAVADAQAGAEVG